MFDPVPNSVDSTATTWDYVNISKKKHGYAWVNDTVDGCNILHL